VHYTLKRVGRSIEIDEAPLNLLILAMAEHPFRLYRVERFGEAGSYGLHATRDPRPPDRIDRFALAHGIADLIDQGLADPAQVGLGRRASTFARVLYAVTERPHDSARIIDAADYEPILAAACRDTLLR
jgi:hypothetical protein